MIRNVSLAWASITLTLGLIFSSSLHARSLPEFTELVEQQKPTVVNISTEYDHTDDARLQGDPRQQVPEIFRRFFGDDLVPGQPQQRRGESLGSGFIISADGYILTNNHVVEGADKIIVRFFDRRVMEAELIGSDARSDLALLKVDAQDLPTSKHGDSDKLKEGEWVLAIGSPFGLDYSVTAGIISAIRRNLPSETYVPFIQTDVAINPGNSGGPLFNMDGEVIGINSQIYTRSGGYMGLSFAIPINVAMNVVEQIKTQGFVSRGWLGVSIQDVTRDLAESFGLDKPAGALITEVMEDSPAQKAGLEPADIITKFDGKEILLRGDLPLAVGATKAGTRVPVEIVREGKKETIMLQVGEMPEDADNVISERRSGDRRADIAGMTVMDLNERMQQDSGVSQGVVVVQVTGGAALAAGLQRGDIITLLANQRTDDVTTLLQVIEALPANRSVPMRILRNGNAIFLPFKPQPN